MLETLRKSILAACDNAFLEVTDHKANQRFGYVDHFDHVIFCAGQYSVNAEEDTEQYDTIGPALIFDGFRDRVSNDHIGPRYKDRAQYCLSIHATMLKEGYRMTSCVHHSMSEGDNLSCQYQKGGESWYGSVVDMVYSPTDYDPDGAIVVRHDNKEKVHDAYYTPCYEEGELTYVTADTLDGHPIMSIQLTKIEGQVWKGMAMSQSFLKEVSGMHISRITSRTVSMSHEAVQFTYTGTHDTKEPVEIIVRKFSRKA